MDVCLDVWMFVWIFVCMFVWMFGFLFVCLFGCLFGCLDVCLEATHTTVHIYFYMDCLIRIYYFKYYFLVITTPIVCADFNNQDWNDLLFEDVLEDDASIIPGAPANNCSLANGEQFHRSALDYNLNTAL